MKKSPEQSSSSEKTSVFQDSGIKRFAFTYLILMSIFFFLIGFTPFQKIVDINGLYTRGVVATTAWLLVRTGIPCTHEGSIIQLPSIALDVKFGCNGLEAVMIYAVAVLAFPASWRKKLVGIAAGFVVLQVLNIFRIAGLGFSGVRFPSLFEYIHIYIAQGMMIAVALGVFFVYLNYARK